MWSCKLRHKRTYILDTGSSRTGRKAKQSKQKLPKPLKLKEVFNPCPTANFDFRSTKNLKSSFDIISQDRAVRAIEMGLGIEQPGYNIFAAGIEGTGKTSVIRHFLEKRAKKSPPPGDWIYVHNFQSPENPTAIPLPAGEGRILKKNMMTLIKGLKKEIPMALQSEEYENAVNSYLSSSNERKSVLFSELEKLAKSMEFVLKSSRMGIETVPIVDGRALSEKDYSKLSEPNRQAIEKKRGKLEPHVLDFARKVRGIEQESRDYIEALRKELGNQIITALIEPLQDMYKNEEEISKFLYEVKEDVLENLLDFLVDDEKDEEEAIILAHDEKDRFTKYKVNLFLDNEETEYAPVITENNPTYYNLFGKIEKNVEHGMYLTDFTMIKAGSIHKANGGYLVLNVLDIFRNYSIWDTLKRVLRNRQGFIEDMGEQYSLLPTSGIRPEPIPLNLKVILIGSDEIYHLLFEDDTEFQKIFKIKAEFDYRMPIGKKNINSYVSFIATRATKENLLPFDRSAVAAIVEFSSRIVENQAYLSTQFSKIKDLTIESDYMARSRGGRQVKREDVEKALDEKHYRLNLQEDYLHKMIESEDLLISVNGHKIGQINGLAVYDYGDYSFGKVSRITCITSTADGGITNIERASRLSGRIHDKGMMILNGYINGLLSFEKPLDLAASIAFEQSYGMIDGDSASVAELIALLSALSEIPIFQNLAVTGSINQMGQIQPIGGVNEKIEGYYKTCKIIGKKGTRYKVIIPKQNVINLMLNKETRTAVKSGELEIFPAEHIWEAFEIATGKKLGSENIHMTNNFPKDSAIDLIMKKLKKLDTLDEATETKTKTRSTTTKKSNSNRKKA